MELKHIFGDTPVIKILDFLIDHREHDYSKTEIAKHINIGWTTISRHWGNILDWDLVTPTRHIGRATMYTLNDESPVVIALLAFDNAVTTWASQEHGISAWGDEDVDPVHNIEPTTE